MAKIALLIGVSEYEPGLDGLPSAVNDVTAMQQVLTNPEMGEFAADAVTVLQNPSRQTMETAIYNLFANRQKEDLVLLYFSGHGVVDDGGEFYFASRFTRKEQGRLVPTTAVAARSVRDWMQQSRSQQKVIILDSCFSGAFAKGVSAKDSGSVNPEIFLGGKGTAILTASTSTQYAISEEDFDLSVYTRYLIEGIRTGGADQNGDGLISVEELHAYASSKVKEAAPAMTPEFYPVKEGYKILLVKSPKDDPKLRYRKKVQTKANQGQGKFDQFVRDMLESSREEWGISLEDAQAIENEVLQPYHEYEKKLNRYEQTLAEAVKSEYPFSPLAQANLKEYQQHLALREADIEEIEARVLTPMQTKYEQQKELEQQQQVSLDRQQKAEAPQLQQSIDKESSQMPMQAEPKPVKWKFWRVWILATCLSVFLCKIELEYGLEGQIRDSWSNDNTFTVRVLYGSLLPLTIGFTQWLIVCRKIFYSLWWLLALSVNVPVVYVLAALGAVLVVDVGATETSGTVTFVVIFIALMVVTGSLVLRLLPKRED